MEDGTYRIGPIRRWCRRITLSGFFVSLVFVAFSARYFTRDYESFFADRKGNLVDIERRTVETSAMSTTFAFDLRTDNGLTAHARMRVPKREGKYRGILMPTGLEVGSKVLDLIEERDDMVVVAVDFISEYENDYDGKILGEVREGIALRNVSMDGIPRQLLGLELLLREPAVDIERISVVGASYGSYAAVAAAAMEPRVRNLILVQGPGQIKTGAAILAARKNSGVPPPVVGWLAQAVFWPFRPEYWLRKGPARPVTFVPSHADPYFPAAAIEAVYESAREPKKIVWNDTPHVESENTDLIAELLRVVMEQIEAETGESDTSG